MKWAGGKSRLLHELAARVPRRVRTYAEPFAGGAALFFALASEALRGERKIERVVLADRNEELVACYRAVKSEVASVIDALATGYAPRGTDRDFFYDVRAMDTRGKSDVERAARFVYLNRTCFNGLWRVNASGGFNVPFGKYKNPRVWIPRGCARRRARSRSPTSVVVRLLRRDARARERRLRLPRPAVRPDLAHRLVHVVREGRLRPGHQERLARELHAPQEAGARAMLSNADTPTTRALYAGLEVHAIRAPRSISCDGATRAAVGELVVTNWASRRSAPRAERVARARAATDAHARRASLRPRS